MLQTRQAMTATSLLLQAQIDEGEKKLAAVKKELAEAIESKGMDVTRANNLDTKLRKGQNTRQTWERHEEALPQHKGVTCVAH